MLDSDKEHSIYRRRDVRLPCPSVEVPHLLGINGRYVWIGVWLWISPIDIRTRGRSVRGGSFTMNANSEYCYQTQTYAQGPESSFMPVGSEKCDAGRWNHTRNISTVLRVRVM